MNKLQILIALVIVSIVGMSSVYFDLSQIINEREKISKPKEAKHGEVRQYTKDHKLKTLVNYNQGIKHGMSYLYHSDGKTILLAMPYRNGKREGISKKYYENGQLYASTSYQNDMLHGPRKTYYSSGKPKAELNYGYGKAGIGTKEYYLDGKLKEMPSIITQRSGTKLLLSTSPPCLDQKFYIGKLVENQYFDPYIDDIQLLETINGQFIIDTEIYTPSYLKYQDIICQCKSRQGNPIVLKKRLF